MILMNRKVRRVPLDFDWPIYPQCIPWPGFIRPLAPFDDFPKCPDCLDVYGSSTGLNPAGRRVDRERLDALTAHGLRSGEYSRLSDKLYDGRDSYYCATCAGHGDIATDAERRLVDDYEDRWEPTEPPTGPGWQLWETVSEGSPISEVFDSAAGLAEWMSSPDYQFADAGWTYLDALRFVEIDASR